MKQLVVLSGKGGTGKTSVSAALADLAARTLGPGGLVLADADVDAPNLELVLRPTLLEEHVFMGGQTARISQETCVACGRCAELCRFGAVLETNGEYRVDPMACEGCAACFYGCSVQAIQLQERQAGLWFRSETRFGPLFHARLFAAQENSGKLVSTVKAQARALAVQQGAALMLVDGPPGIGCPVIAASAGANAALLVTEPTAAGAHDLERVLDTLAHFRVPGLVCINKSDLDPERSDWLESWCLSRNTRVVGRLPYDDAVTSAMVSGDPITAYEPSGRVALALGEVWAQLSRELGL